MNKWVLRMTVVFVTLIFIIPAFSGMKKLAQTGMQFLKVDMSARAAGMGSAYMMAGKGAEAMFYNPAGLSESDTKVDVFVTQTQWIADITYNAAGLALNLSELGTFGISAQVVDYGTIEGAQVANNDQGYIKTGDLDVGAYAVGLSYARSLTNKFSIGGQVKWVSQHLGSSLLNNNETVNNEVSGLAFDFGTIFYPGWKSFRFGMSIRNFSTEFKYNQDKEGEGEEGFQLPLTFIMGVGMDLMDFMELEDQSLLLAIDALHPRDYSERVHIGLEYTYNNLFVIRTGYKYNYDEEGLTGGFGVSQSLGGVLLKIDYAYSPMNIFDAVNRFTVGFGF